MVKRVITGGLRASLGRRNLARLGRLLSNEARLDLQNDMDSNGERLVQKIVLQHAPAGKRLVVFDVGANVGDWTQAFLDAAAACGRQDFEVHSFEPCAATHAMLSRNVQAGIAASRVVPVQKALSNSPGTATLNVVADGCGINSLHDSNEPDRRKETIELTTADAYCKERGLDRVTLLKIDTEGHDLSVVEGAGELLRTGSLDVIQFEYNHRWVFSRRYLRDAFELFEPLGYCIGKVTPHAIEFYKGWHPELESFREGNYLACRPEWMARFPRIPWWNEH